MTDIQSDIALKCGDDVASAIQRNLQLIDDHLGAMQVVIAGAAIALSQAVGVLAAVGKIEPDASIIDGLWRDSIRPLTLSTIGDRAGMERLYAQIDALKADQPCQTK